MWLGIELGLYDITGQNVILKATGSLLFFREMAVVFNHFKQCSILWWYIQCDRKHQTKTKTNANINVQYTQFSNHKI